MRAGPFGTPRWGPEAPGDGKLTDEDSGWTSGRMSLGGFVRVHGGEGIVCSGRCGRAVAPACPVCRGGRTDHGGRPMKDLAALAESRLRSSPYLALKNVSCEEH